MTSHNNKTAFLMYKTNRFHFAVRVCCNRSRKTPYREKNKKSWHSTSFRAVLFSSFHAMTSSVIYYSTHARQNEICMLNINYLLELGNL